MGRREGRVEEARWAVEKASERVEKGDAEGALRLLEQVQLLHPCTPGLSELVALAQVCHAASCCSAAPHWHRILMISEKDDQTVVRKRYRQLALLLHPDKNKHARAEEAFKLISEAYGHLSDGKKQETSDLKKECGTCSFECQPSCWDSMRCNGETLKGKINQNDFQSCYFPFGFHTAEWKVEHEKLRMFRERAQAKVDSLARVLRERRSKWNEEFGQTKGNSRKKSHCNSDRSSCCSEVLSHRSQGAAEKEAVNSRSYSDKVNASSGGGASKNRNQKLFQVMSHGGHIARVDMLSGKELGSRRSREKQSPPVLQSRCGVLRIVREEMGEGFHVSFGGAADAKAGDEQQCRETQGHDAACHRHNRWVKCGCSTLGKSNKLVEEWIVIDDFLAGLNEVNGQSTGQASERAEKKCAVMSEAANGGAASSSFVKEQATTTTMPQQAHLNEWFEGAEDCNKLKDPTTASSFAQMNKHSEQQRLMTLERLRDETKSAAATLKSLKEARIFAGKYHVPASIIAT